MLVGSILSVNGREVLVAVLYGAIGPPLALSARSLLIRRIPRAPTGKAGACDGGFSSTLVRWCHELRAHVGVLLVFS
jgi:hypothetical protein